MQEIIIDSSNENRRFDKFLKIYFQNATSGFIYKMLRKKNITLNGKKDSGNSLLKSGDVINVYFSDDTFNKMRGLDSSQKEYDYYKSLDYKLDVIYEDESIIACNKPAGLLSQKSKDSDISINEYIIAYLINEKGYSLDEYRTFHPSVSNRLDYNTTGVILAAKTLKGQQNLSYALKHHKLDKYYICITAGEVREKMTLTGQLTKDENTNKVTVSDKKDGNIITEIIPIRSNLDISLLKIRLLTGKTHQIRAHLAHIGHPIIGDVKYGDNELNERYKQKYGITTQALHSYATYYDNKEIIAPLPKTIKRLIEEEYGNVEL